jgi:hypothetical protein
VREAGGGKWGRKKLRVGQGRDQGHQRHGSLSTPPQELHASIRITVDIASPDICVCAFTYRNITIYDILFHNF